jgi:hypothetical protein
VGELGVAFGGVDDGGDVDFLGKKKYLIVEIMDRALKLIS